MDRQTLNYIVFSFAFVKLKKIWITFKRSH